MYRWVNWCMKTMYIVRRLVNGVLLLATGKSTVAALLERYYDPQQGGVYIDGHDLRYLDPSWVRGCVLGFINQEPVLFATSVMENIRYGNPSCSDDEVSEH